MSNNERCCLCNTRLSIPNRPIVDIGDRWDNPGVSTKADEFDYSSTAVPEAALFVAADEPLLVFPSAAAAERLLEAIDVENGVYPAAYGPRGEPYSVRAIQDRVRVEPTGEPERPDELRTLLLRYLQGSSREPDRHRSSDFHTQPLSGAHPAIDVPSHRLRMAE